MKIIPAIDILQGQCVRLYQGEYEQSEVFSPDPVAVASHWAAQGADRIHLVDLDGARDGHPVNLAVIHQIRQAVSLPLQVGGGLRDRERVAQLLDLGVDQVVLGTVAVEDPQLVARVCREFSGRVLVGIDARDGKVATRGWRETSTLAALDLVQEVGSFGVAGVIYTDIHRDGTLQGPNLAALREVAQASTVPVIASGGVSSGRDLLGLLSLEPLGVSGVILGRALYTGALSLPEALRAVGQGRIQDVPPNLGSSALA